MVEEEAEYQQDDYDVIAQNSPPGCYFGGDIGHKAEKTSMRQNTISINSGGTTKITPVSTKGPPPPKKARTTTPGKESNHGNSPFAYSCLACGEMQCPYDNGFTVLMECEGEEFDPAEHHPMQAATEQVSAVPLLLPFTDIEKSLRMVITGIMDSKGVWATNKYIGNPRLDSKLKTWMRNRLPQTTLVDSPNWVALRYSVKETFRYKRQKCVRLIRTRFMRE